MNKYKNNKCEADGIKFDSKVEKMFYIKCKEDKLKGYIKDFRAQERFLLQEEFILSGEKRRKIEYVADFVIVNNDGSEAVIDIKGSLMLITDTFKIKKKLFEYKYKKELKVLIHRKETGFVDAYEYAKILKAKKKEKKLKNIK